MRQTRAEITDDRCRKPGRYRRCHAVMARCREESTARPGCRRRRQTEPIGVVIPKNAADVEATLEALPGA
jgi:hypothetical protein